MNMLREDLGRAVEGTIIDDDNFEGGIVLIENGSQPILEVGFFILDRQEDGDERGLGGAARGQDLGYFPKGIEGPPDPVKPDNGREKIKENKKVSHGMDNNEQ